MCDVGSSVLISAINYYCCLRNYDISIYSAYGYGMIIIVFRRKGPGVFRRRRRGEHMCIYVCVFAFRRKGPG